jgi:hypothetical protein
MIDALDVEFVDFIPAELTPATLYVSMQYATTIHLCACGCGNKVVAPLSPAEWQLRFDGVTISLTPSIGNWEFPCRSHYWVIGSSIRLAGPWSDQQITAGRQRDLTALDQYHAGWPETVTKVEQVGASTRTRIRLRRRVRAWFGR